MVWMDCGIHAREWIAPAFCQWFVKEVGTSKHNLDATYCSDKSRTTLSALTVFKFPSLLSDRLCSHIKPMKSWSRCCRILTSMLLLWSMWMDTYLPGPMTVWVLFSGFIIVNHFSVNTVNLIHLDLGSNTVNKMTYWMTCPPTYVYLVIGLYYSQSCDYNWII